MEREALLNKTIEETEEQVRKLYKEISKEIIKQIELVYYKIIASKDEVRANDIYKFDRYYKLLNEISRELKVLGSKENLILDKSMKKMYEINAKLIGEQLNINSSVNQDAMYSAITAN